MIPNFENHISPVFTREELSQLLVQDRVLAPVTQIPEAGEFHYFVCQAPRRRGVKGEKVLAWRVNARGEKDPSQSAPVLVDGDELTVLDFAEVTLRRAFTDYAWSKVNTFLFSSRHGGEVRAVGVGCDLRDASDDALQRLKQRYSGADFPAHVKSLQMQLLERVAYVVETRRGAFLTQEEMGHDYMSNETMLVAQTLSSDYTACEAYLERCVRGGLSVSDLFLRDALRFVPGIDIGLVDWSEVAASFPDGIALRESLRAPKVETVEEGIQGPIDGARSVEADVLEVLRSSVAEGSLVRLPSGRLDPRLYKRVNAVLEALGGIWIGRKVKAHQFEVDAEAVLDVVTTTGRYVRPQDFGYFPTPDHLVEKVLELAEIEPGMLLLEPSAGTGAFARPMAERCGGHQNVTVVELLPGNARKLRESGFSEVIEGDFLSMEPSPVYSRVVMNPPFNGGVDVDHVLHAAKFLKPDGKLIAITSVGWEFHNSFKAQAFRDFLEESLGDVQEVDAGAFKQVGTNVSTRIICLDAVNFPWHREVGADRPLERQRG